MNDYFPGELNFNFQTLCNVGFRAICKVEFWTIWVGFPPGLTIVDTLPSCLAAIYHQLCCFELESISAAFDSLYSRLSKLLSALSISLKYNSQFSSSSFHWKKGFQGQYYNPIGNSLLEDIGWNGWNLLEETAK